MSKREIPILPIPNLVFFANTSLPIYVIDPIFVDMIHYCVDNNLNVGVALIENPRTPLLITRNICSTGTPVILDKLEDGTLKVLIKGSGRVRLLQIEQHLPYPIFTVEDYSDQADSFSHPEEVNKHLYNLLETWLYENIPSPVERESFSQSLISIHHVVDYICMFLIHDIELKQMMLENNSKYERMLMLNMIFKTENSLSPDYLAIKSIKKYEYLEHCYSIAN